jgi:hypothetical protein
VSSNLLHRLGEGVVRAKFDARQPASTRGIDKEAEPPCLSDPTKVAMLRVRSRTSSSVPDRRHTAGRDTGGLGCHAPPRRVTARLRPNSLGRSGASPERQTQPPASSGRVQARAGVVLIVRDY